MVKVMQFEPGDVVSLKSGSVRMTVLSVNYADGVAEVTVTWMVYETKNVMRSTFPHVALTPAEPRRSSRSFGDEVEF